MSTANQMSVPEKRKKEEEANPKKEEEGESKRKRPKPPPCKCKETVKRVNSMLRDAHEYILDKVINFPELTGKILEVTQKAVNNEIVTPLHLYTRQLIDEEHRGFDTTLRKLDKSRLCRARIHYGEDVFPALSAAYASDESEEEESD